MIAFAWLSHSQALQHPKQIYMNWALRILPSIQYGNNKGNQIFDLKTWNFDFINHFLAFAIETQHTKHIFEINNR